MKYFKVIENTLIPAPQILEVDGKQIVSPSDEMLREAGYLPQGEAQELADSWVPPAEETQEDTEQAPSEPTQEEV